MAFISIIQGDKVMEVLFFLLTVFVSLFAEIAIGIKLFNLPGMGCIVGIAFVGAVILYTIRHNHYK